MPQLNMLPKHSKVRIFGFVPKNTDPEATSAFTLKTDDYNRDLEILAKS